MSKQIQIPLMNSSLFDDHPLMQWVEKNGRMLLIALLALISLLFFLYRQTASKHSQAEQDYFQAANAIVQMKDPAKTSEALADLQLILAKHPELNARYDGPIAEDLLVANNLNAAEPYAERTFQRVTSDMSPLYLQYAKTSLTIAAGKSEEALKEAFRLKGQLLDTNAKLFGPDLYLFNLIRIAMLERTLNQKEEEHKTWDELLQIGKGNAPVPISSSDFERVISSFESEGVSLLEFIKHQN